MINVIDKFYEVVNPQKALDREAARLKLGMARQINPLNSGYDGSGASRTKKSMLGWRADSRSAFEDIEMNRQLLTQRSRSLYMTSPIAISAIKTTRTNVIGAGLRLKSRIDFNLLGITQEEADQ